ncbi:MAG: alpha/beta hydrolase [Bdellovibrio sp.]|nr:MAG: alpha/beta hydrolase [Bdellovibrio sp.]
MTKPKSENIKIATETGEVSGILDSPVRIVAGLTLAHGAGAGMHHKFMTDLAVSLACRGFAVLRFQFPYMETGRKRTDPPSIAIRTVEAAVDTLRKRIPEVPVLAAGKSFGARMTTTAAAAGLLAGIEGIICYGFPLHPPGRPGVERAKHLAQVPVPMLFLQGTRDELTDLKLMREVCSKLPRAKLKIIEGADHGFGVLKRSGRTSEDVMNELVDESMRFATGRPFSVEKNT